MSLENLFRCCNKYDFITQVSGVLLGTMVGYGILKPSIDKIKNKNVDEELYEGLKEQIRNYINVSESENFGVPDYFTVPLTLDILDENFGALQNNIINAITNAIINNVGPIFTVVGIGSGTLIISSYIYNTLVYLNRFMNMAAININNINEAERDLEIIFDSAQNNINNELKKKSLPKDTIKKIQKQTNINKEVLKDILDILNDMSNEIKKSGGDTDYIKKNIDKVINIGEEVFIVKGKNKIFDESEIMITNEGISSTAVNTQEVNIQRENQRLINNISNVVEVEYRPNIETVRRIWRSKFKETEKLSEEKKTKEEEEEEENESVNIIINEVSFNGTLEEFRLRLNNFGNNIRIATINFLEDYLGRFEKLRDNSNKNSNVLNALIEDIKNKLNEYKNSRLLGILQAIHGYKKNVYIGIGMLDTYTRIGNDFPERIAYNELFKNYQRYITYLNTRTTFLIEMKKKYFNNKPTEKPTEIPTERPNEKEELN